MSNSEKDNINLSEVTVLGNILADSSNEARLTASQSLSPDDFSDPRNRIIFETRQERTISNIKPDEATLKDALVNKKVFDEVGGDDYLDTILNKMVRFTGIDQYVYAIRDRSLLNTFLSTLNGIINDAKVKPISNVSDFIGKAEVDILNITHQRRIKQAFKLSDINDRLVTKLVTQSERFKKEGIRPDGITGIRSGYGDLDKLTRGFQRGDRIIIGARPSVGKTAFALNLLYKIAEQGIPVIFFSLEMSSVAINTRLLQIASGLSSNEINSRIFKPGSTQNRLLVETNGDPDLTSKVKRLQNGRNTLRNRPFYIDDNTSSKRNDIVTRCQKLKNQINNVGLIAIDYLGLITSSSKRAQDNRQNEVAEISRQIKQMARDLDVPVLALSQLSRESAKRNADHTPQLSDLRDSGSIEQDADRIFMIDRPDYFNKPGVPQEGDQNAPQPPRQQPSSPFSKTIIRLLKNRNGPTGNCNFRFDKEHQTFTALDDNATDDGF